VLGTTWRASHHGRPSSSLLGNYSPTGARARAAASPPCGPTAVAWENTTLGEFLEALSPYVEDADLPDEPSSRTFAQLLAAASMYECSHTLKSNKAMKVADETYLKGSDPFAGVGLHRVSEKSVATGQVHSVKSRHSGILVGRHVQSPPAELGR